MASAALIAVIACGLLPASASAELFTVDNLDDPGDGSCTPGSCSLREAIAESNDKAGLDEIKFSPSGQGQITLEANPLSAIVDDLTIAAPTPGGIPTVAIEGSATQDDPGLRVDPLGSADISGLAISGFDEGSIVLNGSEDDTICGNHLGTDLAGTFPKPNWIGVTVMNGAKRTEIGWGCETGNVISANEGFGIFDEGEETRIAGNRIGTDVTGSEQMPNGLAGIKIGVNAERPLITYNPGSPPTPNTIAFSEEGPGVLVDNAESLPVIVGNSIFANEGVGIEFDAGEFNPPPTLESAEVSGGQLLVKGTLGLAGGQTLDFYANEECDPSGFGEGQTPLGFDEFESGGPGTPFEAVLEAMVSSDQPVITATTTVGGELSATGPFSNCVEAEGIPGPPDPPGPPAPPPPTPQPLVLASPVPVNTQSVVVETVSGKVLVKVPGSGKFVDLATLTSIPIGSIVDATRGKVRLTSVNAAGVEQSAVFYDGMFRITRQDRSGLVTLRLVGGDFSHCKKARGSSATSSKRKGRQLWGSGKGRFRTEGNFGAAVTRGTIWLTKDQCKGTFIRVRQGKVSVTDFVLEKTFNLPAGKGYWAKKNP